MILLLLACGSQPLFEAGLLPVQGAEARSADRCESCHPKQTLQWRGSRHAAAWTNPVFAASIEHSLEKQWCMNCHAPLPEQQTALHSGELGLAEEGVTCVVCHLRDGQLLTSQVPSKAAVRAHPIRRERRLGRSEFCGECHDFPFIDLHERPALVYTDTPMQDTLSEWRSSSFAPSTTCQDCHMAEHGHGFPGAHDAEMLLGSLSAEVAPDPLNPGYVFATVTSTGVGHAVPSGDPFRRLELRICPDADCEEPSEVRYFTRRFSGDDERNWVLFDSQHVPPPRRGETSSHTRPVKVEPDSVKWQLVYAYGDPRLEAGLPPDEVERVVAEGPIP